jgi:hypothetical protein
MKILKILSGQSWLSRKIPEDFLGYLSGQSFNVDKFFRLYLRNVVAKFGVDGLFGN